MRNAVLPLALLFVLTGCGAAREAPSGAEDESAVVASVDPSEVTAKILGATPKQETILREILAGLGRDTRIEAVQVMPDGKKAQSVAVDVHAAPGHAVRREWEILLVANAFADRSRRTGLQRVTSLFIDGEPDSSLDSGDPVQPRDPVTAETLSEEVFSGAKKSGARLARLELLHPNNDAVYVKLQVGDPAAFLEQRASAFLATVQTPNAARYDGLFIEVVDGNGELAWSSSDVVSEDGGEMTWGYNRPELTGCDPIHSIGGAPFKAPPPPCPSGKLEAHVSRDVTTRIVGATPKQETVLREILGGLGDNVVEEIRVAPAGRDWTPYHPNSVVVRLKTAKTDKNGRADWEAELVAQAFAARSRALLLQPVAAYETANGGSRLDGPTDESHPDTRTPLTRKEIESGVVNGAKASGAQIVELRILKPRNLAAAVTLQVDQPAVYLKHHLRDFLKAVPSSSTHLYDGLYVRVIDAEGKFVWLSADHFGETLSGRTHGTRPDLLGCDPTPRLGGPIGSQGAPAVPGGLTRSAGS